MVTYPADAAAAGLAGSITVVTPAIAVAKAAAAASLR